MTGKDILLWQARLNEMPCVYWVVVFSHYDRCWQPTGAYYQTLAGAQTEQRWQEARGHRANIQSAHMHSDALATERWLRERTSSASYLRTRATTERQNENRDQTSLEE